MSLNALLNDTSDQGGRKKMTAFVVGFAILIVGLMGITFAHFINPTIYPTPRKIVAAEPPRNTAMEASVISGLLEAQAQTEEIKTKLSDRLKNMGSEVKQKMGFDHSSSAAMAPGSVASRGPAGIPLISVAPGNGFSSITNKGEDPYIPTGAVFRAQLIMPIKTSVQESFVMAQTTSDYQLDAVRRIPKGCRLIGTARLNPMLKGVIVHFNLLVSPKGIEYPISILALSSDLFPELDGIYFTNQLETYSSILAFGFISGFANASQQRDTNIFGVDVPKENASNAVLNGVSTASFRVTQDLIEDIRKRAVEYVVLPAGEKIFLVFDKKFTLKDSKPIGG